MKRRWRELALVAITAALLLALSVQLHRAEPLPAPAAMTAFVAPLPPVATRCSAVGFPGKPPRKIVDARPVYPLTAARAHVSGVVMIEVEIDEQGHVSHPRVVRSVPLLDQAALDAVAKSQFEPATRRGEPACVTMTLAVEFPPE